MRKVENKMQEGIKKPEQRQASLPFHHTGAECAVLIVCGLDWIGEALQHNRP